MGMIQGPYVSFSVADPGLFEKLTQRGNNHKLGYTFAAGASNTGRTGFLWVLVYGVSQTNSVGILVLSLVQAWSS